MVQNNNEINFEDNKPWLAPHYPFSLEGHWQPWYDDRRDYGTNAPTYYDYLSNFNHLIKSIVELLNRVVRRNVKVEDTNCIDMTKINDWIDEGNECHTWHDDIILKADVILSSYQKILQFDGHEYALNNAISCLSTGLYVSDYLPLLEALKDKLNQEILDRIEGDDELNQKIENVKNELIEAINNLRQEFNEYKNSNNAEVDQLKQEVDNLKNAIQKIVTNLFDGGNATTNDINTFNIVNKIAAGNINLFGGVSDGQSLIRTHKGQAENDVTIGTKG
jgi:hypothetical protein